MGLMDAMAGLLDRRPRVTLDDAAPGAALSTVAKWIGEISKAGIVSRRVDAKTYLEGTVSCAKLDTMIELLDQRFGLPTKPFRKSVRLGQPLGSFVDSCGGIARNQCLYLRRFEDNYVAYAALWPWSNGETVTLKLGVYATPLPT